MELLLLIGAHAIGDYALQSDYIAKNKGLDFWILLMHVFIWCTSISLCWSYLGNTILLHQYILILFIPHLICDYLKSHNLTFKNNKVSIILDQSIHIFQILILLLVS